MTYGEQIWLLRLRIGQMLSLSDGDGLQGLLRNAEAFECTVTGDVPEVDMLKPYTGYETLRVDLNDPANWSWYGPGGERE